MENQLLPNLISLSLLFITRLSILQHTLVQSDICLWIAHLASGLIQIIFFIDCFLNLNLFLHFFNKIMFTIWIKLLIHYTKGILYLFYKLLKGFLKIFYYLIYFSHECRFYLIVPSRYFLLLIYTFFFKDFKFGF